MSAIEEKLKQIKAQENKLLLDQRKIEFLNHILTSAEEYDHRDFQDVKSEVVCMLKGFVQNATVSIENGTELKFNAESNPMPVINTQGAETSRISGTKPNEAQEPQRVVELSPHEKMNFAINNRHLGGKVVSVLNDKNVDIKGEVVGLDAPDVIVKTTTGPTIRVPLEKVVLQ